MTIIDYPSMFVYVFGDPSSSEHQQLFVSERKLHAPRAELQPNGIIRFLYRSIVSVSFFPIIYLFQSLRKRQHADVRCNTFENAFISDDD